MWTGWLIAEVDDKKFLENLGVKILDERVNSDFSNGIEYEIEIDNLDALDPYWGRFIWGLEEVKR